MKTVFEHYEYYETLVEMFVSQNEDGNSHIFTKSHC